MIIKIRNGYHKEKRLKKNYKITSLTLKTGSAAVVIVAASVGGISAVSNAGDTVGYKYKYSRIKITRQMLGILHTKKVKESTSCSDVNGRRG